MALLFIGTSRYVEFFPMWHESLARFFLPMTRKGFFVFTDRVDEPSLRRSGPDVNVVGVAHERFPLVNLLKYKIINTAAAALEDYSHVVYIDADMCAVSSVPEHEFWCHDKPLFAVQHYNYVRLAPKRAFERRPSSQAAVSPTDDLSTYWQSCFWGGRREAVLAATDELERRTDDDLRRGVVAAWWDESFLNKYLIEKKANVHTHSPMYSWPQHKPVPERRPVKFLHLIDNPSSLAATPSIKAAVRRHEENGHQKPTFP